MAAKNGFQASPLTRVIQSGLVAVLLTALHGCGGGGSGESSTTTGGASSSGSSTGVATTTGSTSGVLCNTSVTVYNSSASVQANSVYSWTCNASVRMLSANGIPDHAVGTFPNPNNPNTISARTVSANMTLTPSVRNASGTATQVIGFGINGIKFDPDTGGTCNDSGSSCSMVGGTGSWRIEALGQSSFNFGTDSNNAHVQPDGSYHYHGMPEGLRVAQGKGTSMTLVGWAVDGFPIYARYGYTTANDATSAIKVLTGSYRTKSSPDTGRPSVSTYPMGTFKQDWEYVPGLGDLDECNGRTGVTPEFPGGTYYYVTTDSYPFVQRCIKG